jgi:hypothetical protein
MMLLHFLLMALLVSMLLLPVIMSPFPPGAPQVGGGHEDCFNRHGVGGFWSGGKSGSNWPGSYKMGPEGLCWRPSAYTCASRHVGLEMQLSIPVSSN